MTIHHESNNETWLDNLKWDNQGLIPAIAQDEKTGKVVMFAWMNRQSLSMSIAMGQAVYWSRSRNKIWPKGEESGHIQKIKSLRVDCDKDVILISIEQIGGIACHTGRESCFYFELTHDSEHKHWQIIEPILKDPKEIYQKK
jgi:phosphoribosyl-AMP cyclohydrolase